MSKKQSPGTNECYKNICKFKTWNLGNHLCKYAAAIQGPSQQVPQVKRPVSSAALLAHKGNFLYNQSFPNKITCMQSIWLYVSYSRAPNRLQAIARTNNDVVHGHSCRQEGLMYANTKLHSQIFETFQHENFHLGNTGTAILYRWVDAKKA